MFDLHPALLLLSWSCCSFIYAPLLRSFPLVLIRPTAFFSSSPDVLRNMFSTQSRVLNLTLFSWFHVVQRRFWDPRAAFVPSTLGSISDSAHYYIIILLHYYIITSCCSSTSHNWAQTEGQRRSKGTKKEPIRAKMMRPP